MMRGGGGRRKITVIIEVNPKEGGESGKLNKESSTQLMELWTVKTDALVEGSRNSFG